MQRGCYYIAIKLNKNVMLFKYNRLPEISGLADKTFSLVTGPRMLISPSPWENNLLWKPSLASYLLSPLWNKALVIKQGEACCHMCGCGGCHSNPPRQRRTRCNRPTGCHWRNCTLKILDLIWSISPLMDWRWIHLLKTFPAREVIIATL